jgi:hypothetical protein
VQGCAAVRSRIAGVGAGLVEALVIASALVAPGCAREKERPSPVAASAAVPPVEAEDVVPAVWNVASAAGRKVGVTG